MNPVAQTAKPLPLTVPGRPPTRPAPRFGQRLAALRKQQGLSQEALARQLGTTRDNIAYYERKAGNPSLHFIERCAAALNLAPQELIAEGPKGRSPGLGLPARLLQLSRRLATLPRVKRQAVIELLEAVLDKARA